MKIKFTISYDGTNYFGWQKQPNKITVQEVVEKAIFEVLGKSVKLTASGRTDTGVHAKGQVAHAEITTKIPADKLKFCINEKLPKDIKILESEKAEDNFHAIASAKKKTYEYCLYESKVIEPLLDRFCVRIDKMPSLEKMQEVAKLFIGKHDFKAFSSLGSSVKTTEREIYALEISKTENVLKIRVTGNGFLYNMVRIIVGTIIAFGEGKISKEQIENAFITKKRLNEFKTMPPNGLTLIKVDYQ